MPTIRIVGQERAIARLAKLGRLDMVRRALLAGGLHLKSVIAVYPPSSIANDPSQKRWYERGYGPRWRTRSGIHGRATSKQLGRKWTVAAQNQGMRVVVGNAVSYARYVQDWAKQARFHAARGWKTDAQVVGEERERVVEFVVGEIRKALA